MFLDRLLKTNEPLAQLAFAWQQDGTVLPDTYLIDLDMLTKNAESIKGAADAHGIKLYFMLKQLGRNSILAHRLTEVGYAGAVCVDYREALVMAEAGVPLGNVGHLVQTPRAAMERIVAARPDIMTVYSVEKAAEIGAAAQAQGFVQPIILRVIGEGDMLYPGQYGGFPLAELDATVDAIEALPGVRIAGVCSFPCLLFSDEEGRVVPTPNAETVRRAATALEARGYHDLQLNMPSASCTDTVGLVAELGGTHMEPGHGLSRHHAVARPPGRCQRPRGCGLCLRERGEPQPGRALLLLRGWPLPARAPLQRACGHVARRGQAGPRDSPGRRVHRLPLRALRALARGRRRAHVLPHAAVRDAE